MSQDLVSFVLRFVREASEDQQARWRGVVKHVQSNTEASFGQFSEAMLFMQEHVNEVIRSGFEESQQYTEQINRTNPVEESMKLWGTFMSPYSKMMANTMSEAMEAASSAPMAATMEEAVSSTMEFWGLPAKSAKARSDESLVTLTEQVSILADKVSDLEAQLRVAKAEAASEEE